MVRYQTNPTVNWGPAGKARSKKEDAVEGEKALVHGNAGGRKKRKHESRGQGESGVETPGEEEEVMVVVPVVTVMDEDDEEAMMNA